MTWDVCLFKESYKKAATIYEVDCLMMDEILRISKVIENEYVNDWKKKGGKVVGYSCIFTPVEILEAAGLYPFRIRGNGNSVLDLADARLSRYNCSFCRSCLQLGLDGTYDFLDGLIETNGCDQLRGMFENWVYAKPVDFFHYLKVPHIITPESIPYFENELRGFKQNVEEHFGVKITEEKLADAIDRQQRIRDLLRELMTLREREVPGISGSETLQIVLAGCSLPGEIFKRMLERAIEHYSNMKTPEYKARIVLGGAATDEVDFFRMIEQVGGAIVADTLCYGARAFWAHEPVRDSNSIGQLAKMYLQYSMCPRMYDEFPSRLDFIRNAAQRARADGVILVHNKFCDVHGVDNVLLRIRLEQEDIPVLLLEKEYGSIADMGRFKTRIQAFIERIHGRR